jgi:hypothetical protein
MEIKMEQAYNYGGVLSVNGIYTYQEKNINKKPFLIQYTKPIFFIYDKQI